MKSILFTVLLITSISAFSKWSPKIITYNKGFDEIKTLSFDQELFFYDFKVIKEDFFKLDSWMCSKTLSVKSENKTINASGNTLTLISAKVISPYSQCDGLPDFAVISNPNFKNENQHTISLNFNDQNNEELTVQLYGKNRVKLYFRDSVYTGKITETF